MTQDIATAASIADAVARLGTRPWKDETIRSALPGIRAPISEDFVWFSTAIEASLKSHSSRRAEDLLCLALQLAQKAFIEKIKAKGHLRISRYRYEGEVLRRALTAVMSRIGIHMTTDTSDYLQSVIAITALSKDAMRITSRLEATLRKQKSVALKSAYAELDLMFQMSEMNGRDPTSVEHSIEELGEGLSLLTHLYFETVKVEPYDFGFVDEPGLASGKYRRMLEDAMVLRQVGEAETLVDAYGYRATSQNGQVTVRASEELLERSIRYGYIQFQSASTLISHQSNQLHAGLHTCEEVVEAILSRSDRRWLRLLTHPIPRYALALPGRPSSPAQFREIPFRQDAVQVDVAAYDLFCQPEELLALRLKNGLPVEEARQAQRYVDFVRRLFWRELRDLHSLQEPIAMRSRIPVFKRDELKKFFSTCVLDEYIDKVIESLSHSRHSRGFFDIQYRPILEVDGRYVVPMNILGFSNVFRNLLQSTESRIVWPSDRDPVQVALGAALAEAGFRTEVAFQTKHDGRQLDIDVMAIKGDTLYLFECKNPLHPAGVHELRRSLNYAQEAVVQLDRAVAAFKDTQKRTQLFQRLGWKCPQKLRIRTCVMMGNRMFNGWTVGGHAVRSVREAVRMLESGTVGVSGRDYRTLHLRRPTKADLDQFLSGDSFAVQSLKSMEPVQRGYVIGQSSLTFQTFALDLVKLAFAVDSSLPRADLRTPSMRRFRRVKVRRLRSRKSQSKVHRQYFTVDELATWLARPVKNVKSDARRLHPRVPPLAGHRRQRPMQWSRSDVRKWFGIESEAEFQLRIIRQIKASKGKNSSQPDAPHFDKSGVPQHRETRS